MDKINFNQLTGKHSFFSVREKAWHGKGQIVGDYLPSAEVLHLSGLDFEVKKEPNTHIFPNGTSIRSVDSYFTYRDDTKQVLGASVGSRYQILQNVDAMSILDGIIGTSTGVKYETAGALGKGERVFITAKLSSYIQIDSQDKMEKYIFVYNSHDGKGSIEAGFTPIRIVCNNTLNAALKECTNRIKFRHTANAKERLKEAQRVLAMSEKYSEVFEAKMQHWTKVRITDKELRNLIEQAMASEETLDMLKRGNREQLPQQFIHEVNAVLNYNDLHPSQKMLTTRGTLYGAYNAITGYYQNVKEFKSTEKQFVSVMEGTAYGKTQACFELCEKFLNAGIIMLQ